jgi:hypothetical protein
MTWHQVIQLVLGKYNHWHRTEGAAAARRKVSTFLDGFRPVAAYRFTATGGLLEIAARDGEKESLMLTGPPEAKVNRLSPRELAAAAEASADTYRGLFRRDGALLRFTEGTHVYLPSGTARRFRRRVAFITGAGRALDRRLRLDLLEEFIIDPMDRRVFFANYEGKGR